MNDILTSLFNDIQHLIDESSFIRNSGMPVLDLLALICNMNTNTKFWYLLTESGKINLLWLSTMRYWYKRVLCLCCINSCHLLWFNWECLLLILRQLQAYGCSSIGMNIRVASAWLVRDIISIFSKGKGTFDFFSWESHKSFSKVFINNYWYDPSQGAIEVGPLRAFHSGGKLYYLDSSNYFSSLR